MHDRIVEEPGQPASPARRDAATRSGSGAGRTRFARTGFRKCGGTGAAARSRVRAA